LAATGDERAIFAAERGRMWLDRDVSFEEANGLAPGWRDVAACDRRDEILLAIIATPEFAGLRESGQAKKIAAELRRCAGHGGDHRKQSRGSATLPPGLIHELAAATDVRSAGHFRRLLKDLRCSSAELE
jgi:hypothetical protein